jgi:hypothetical protein
MEEFKTTPDSVKIGGNIIGLELGELNDLSAFNNSQATVIYGTPRTIDDREIIFVELSYNSGG